MTVIFNADELNLLLILRELGGGNTSWQRGSVGQNGILEALSWQREKSEKVIDYLRGHGLVELSSISTFSEMKYFLTPLGENFLRHMEVELEQKQIIKEETLTRKTLKEIWTGSRSAIVEVASSVVAKLITGA